MPSTQVLLTMTKEEVEQLAAKFEEYAEACEAEAAELERYAATRES